MKLKYEEYEVGGYLFHIGKGDFYAPVFEIKVGKSFYGVYLVRDIGDELGFNSGIYATEEILLAIKKAEEIVTRIRNS